MNMPPTARGPRYVKESLTRALLQFELVGPRRHKEG